MSGQLEDVLPHEGLSSREDDHLGSRLGDLVQERLPLLGIQLPFGLGPGIPVAMLALQVAPVGHIPRDDHSSGHPFSIFFIRPAIFVIPRRSALRSWRTGGHMDATPDSCGNRKPSSWYIDFSYYWLLFEPERSKAQE